MAREQRGRDSRHGGGRVDDIGGRERPRAGRAAARGAAKKQEVPREKGSQRGYTDDDLEEAIKAHPGNALNAVIVLQQAPGCVVAFRKRLDFAAGMM